MDITTTSQVDCENLMRYYFRNSALYTNYTQVVFEHILISFTFLPRRITWRTFKNSLFFDTNDNIEINIFYYQL